jgi:hypothetical protein
MADAGEQFDVADEWFEEGLLRLSRATTPWAPD